MKIFIIWGINFRSSRNVFIGLILPSVALSIHLMCIAQPVYRWLLSVQFSLTLCSSMDWSTPGFPVHHQLPDLAQTHVHWVGDVIQTPHPLSPLMILLSVLPSIMDFSIESVLHIRWPKCWSFSFSISPSNEYSGLISFTIKWCDLLAVQGILESSPTKQFKSISSSAFSFLYGPTLISIHDYWKNHSFD